MPKTKFTAAEKLAIMQRVSDGASVLSIAKESSIPESTLRFWMKNKQRPKKYDIDEATKKKAIQRAIEGGEKKSAIAKDLNVPESTLRSWVRRKLEEANEIERNMIQYEMVEVASENLEEAIENENSNMIQYEVVEIESELQIRREEARIQLQACIEKAVILSVQIMEQSGETRVTREHVVLALNMLGNHV